MLIDVCRKCPAKIPIMKLDGNVRKALVLRLKIFLEYEEKDYASWKEKIQPRLKKTIADHLDRRFRQRIQAFKMVIWILTPYRDRNDEFPGYWSNN